MKHKSLFEKYLQPLSPVPTGVLPKIDSGADIKAVLFDIYGTLFISASGDISTVGEHSAKSLYLNQLLEKYRITSSADELLFRLKDSIRQTHLILKNEGIDFPEVNIDIIWKDILHWHDTEKVQDFAREFELIVNPVYPMPNLKKTLLFLAGLHLPLGIISNAQFYTIDLFEYFLDKDVPQLGFDPNLIFFSYQFNCAKPSAYLFELASKYLKARGISADNVLYVGNDMLNDISAARKMGFQGALFAGDQRSLRLRKDHKDCKDMEPDYIINDLSQLIDIVK